MPSFLFMNAKTAGAGACTAFQYVNATPTQLGTSFGAGYGTTDRERDAAKNHLVQFQGELYAMARDGVYKKDDPTVTTGGWTQQIAFTSPETLRCTGTGLHPMVVGGVLNLVGVFQEASQSNRFRWVKFDGTTWTQAGAYTEVANLGARQHMDSIVYRGVLYFLTGEGDVNYTGTFDPGTNSFANITNPFVDFSTTVGVGIFQDRLFALGQVSVTDVGLAEFTGGSWNLVGTIEDAVVLGFRNSKWACFSDGTYLYLIYGRQPVVANSRGWRASRWSPTASPNFLDISTEVLPSALLSVTDGGTHSITTNIIEERLIPVYDADTDPANPVIYLYFALNGVVGTGHTMYRWNLNPADVATVLPGNPSNVMTSIDSGGDTQHSAPAHMSQGGCRIFTPGELDVKIVSRVGVLGGEEITFRAYGGGTGRKVKIFYAVGGEPSLLECTLAGPVTGGSATLNTGLNQVEGVAADGATDYTVIWDLAADSVVPSTEIDRFPQVSV